MGLGGSASGSYLRIPNKNQLCIGAVGIVGIHSSGSCSHTLLEGTGVLFACQKNIPMPP